MKAAGTEEGRSIRTDYTAWKLASEQANEHHHAAIYLHTVQAATTEDWRSQLEEMIRVAEHDVDGARTSAREWWQQFWERSRISVDPEQRLVDRKPWQVGRNYALFRYMLGCNAYGAYPTKFNGGLFTVDPCCVLQDQSWETETPDFRRWGGGSFTAQNQCLVYWPLLKSGDFDAMRPQFEFYRRALANADRV